MINTDKSDAPGSQIAQFLSLANGPKGAELATGLALSGMASKQRMWLEKRGRLDDATAKALDQRIEADQDRVRRTAQEVIALGTIPGARSGETRVGGRVTKNGKPQEGLVVSLVGRDGKAHDCGKTDQAGIYDLGFGRAGEVLVLVSDKNGKRQLKLDDRPVTYGDGAIAVRNIELVEAGSCPDGPVTTDRAIMPDVTGKTKQVATGELKQLKIDVERVREVASPAARGTVVETEPPAGHMLGEKPSAVLVVSRGKAAATEVPRAKTDSAAKAAKPSAAATAAARKPSPKE